MLGTISKSTVTFPLGVDSCKKIILYFVHSPGKRKRVVDDTAVAEITNKLAACDINVSDISLEVRSLVYLKGSVRNINVFSRYFNTSDLFIHNYFFLEDY